MRNTFVNTLCELAENDDSIYLLAGDVGYNVLDKFWNCFPDRFINAGIAEQNMIAVAAGMAMQGKTVYVYSIANFPTMRCLEQIRNDVAYHNANVKIVSIGAGFAYAPMGMSHHATEDIAMLRSIPNVKVFSPSDPDETRELTKVANAVKGPVYLRLGKGGEPCVGLSDTHIEYGKMRLVREGRDAVILATGAIVSVAYSVAEVIGDLDIEVYSVPFIKPIEEEAIIRLARQYKTIYVLEEHNRIGGLGSAVSEIICEKGIGAKVVRIGLEETFINDVGDQEYLRMLYGLDQNSIVNIIRNTLFT